MEGRQGAALADARCGRAPDPSQGSHCMKTQQGLSYPHLRVYPSYKGHARADDCIHALHGVAHYRR